MARQPGLQQAAAVERAVSSVASAVPPHPPTQADLPLPDALRPDAVPHTKMYHINLSGALWWGERLVGTHRKGPGFGGSVGLLSALSCPWVNEPAEHLWQGCCARPDPPCSHSDPSHLTLCPAVFRSAVDSWAIQQLFPIVPIHR